MITTSSKGSVAGVVMSMSDMSGFTVRSVSMSIVNLNRDGKATFKSNGYGRLTEGMNNKLETRLND